MIDDLENLSDDELTRVERMININKMIQETNQNHEMNMATIEKMRAETDKFRAEHAMSMATIEKMRADQENNMATIAKMQAETDKFRAEHAMSMATIEKMRAETEKISKETRFYPMLTLTMGLVAVIGGTVAALITKLL